MKVIEYLSKIGINEDSYKELCFVLGKVVGEGPTKQFYYRNTPLRTVHEWFEFYNHSDNQEKNILNYNVLNIHQPVTYWLSGANWNPQIENGNFMSLLVVSDEELSKYYSNEQWKNTLKYIDGKIEEIISNNSK